MNIIRKIILINLTYCFLLCNTLLAADKVFEYGFEDWGGNIASTPDYCFTTSYCTEHTNSTEVVTAYDGISPYSGSYFWLHNHSGYSLDPVVSGITAGTVNAHNNIGANAGACGSDTWDVETSNIANTGECFIRFRMAMDNWEDVTNNNADLKLIRFYNTNSVMFMVPKQNATGLPVFSLFAEGDYRVYTNTISDLDDRTWHKFALYVNYNTGQTALWYDVDNETWENATLKWTDPDGTISGGPTPGYIVTISNWSNNNPTGPVWHALDDIEIWDGLPSAGGADTDPPGDVTDFTAQPGNSEVALSWTNPTVGDFKGTMIRYSTGNDPFPANHTVGTLVCDRAATPGSTDNFTETGLQNGIQYNFSAFTYDDAGNYSKTAHVSATPTAEPNLPPSPPTGLTVVE